jgi:hypothetical protein
MSTTTPSNDGPSKPVKPDFVENKILAKLAPDTVFVPFFTFEDEPAALTQATDPENVNSIYWKGMNSSMRLWEAARRRDKVAAKYLVEMALKMCEGLEELERFTPGIFDGIERKAISWPMAVAPGPANIREIQRRLAKLEVASEAPLRLDAKGKQPDYFGKNPYRLLLRLFRYIEEIRELRQIQSQARSLEGQPNWFKGIINLEDLNQRTAPAWFDVMWVILVEGTEGKPESRPELKALGVGREYDREFYGGHANPPEATRLASIRNGIKSQLKRAFLKMVNADSR